MLTKGGLKKEFGKEWKKYYHVELFKEKGFSRKLCSKCSKAFWTLDAERKICGDSSCEPYGFIGNTITAKKLDYVEMWKEFERFFAKNGHKSIPRYPVVDRWRPDLFFTIASIQDFQRIELGNMSFVYPANPLIVPQMCLRFPDIENVGLTGRHLTSFVMPGQHAFGHPKEGYFKDRCMELDFNFLHKILGIPEKELVYMEDVWAMPDFSAFGPSIETFSKGLELVNHVFMEFQINKDGKTFKPLDIKVNDTGWGHERLVWFSNGTNTMYDCIFGDVVEKMKKESGVKVDAEIFSKYSKLAGTLDVDEAESIDSRRKKIADKIGITVQQLVSQIEPMRAIYAIADHTRTLLFALTDGGIPSNVGGGYNLRVVLRRSLGFIEEYKLNLDLVKIAEQHAKFLKPMFPELSGGLENFQKIIEIEKERYQKTVSEGRRLVSNIISSGEKLDSPKLIQLYESHGITPETVKKAAAEQKKIVEIPDDFYKSLSDKHIVHKETEKKATLNLAGLPDTQLLFYDNPCKKDFEAIVLKAEAGEPKGTQWVVLDKTLFYPEGGGQENDTGKINNCKVSDVQKFAHVVAHKVNGGTFKTGDRIKGFVDWDRREQMMKHHTAIHILNAAAREVLGNHVWQAGTHKSVDKAHLDITHYRPVTGEETELIQQKANQIVKKALKTKSMFLERKEAEKRYGLRIYQGGAIPEKVLRILEIPGWDIEACAGTHSQSTDFIGRIIIVSAERIQDGVVRITIKAGEAADDYLGGNLAYAKVMANILDESGLAKISEKYIFSDKQLITKDLQKAAAILSVPVDQIEKNLQRFVSEISDLEKERGKFEQPEKRKVFEAANLAEAAGYIFSLWKGRKKDMEKLKSETSKVMVAGLAKFVKKGRLFRIVNLDRKEMIITASEMLKADTKLMVVLANSSGDIVGMGKSENIPDIVRRICEKSGGKGGGVGELAQGKADPKKLKFLEEDFSKTGNF